MNQQAAIAAIKQTLQGEMKDALPLLAFLDHLDNKEVQDIAWEVTGKESSLSISIYPLRSNALPVFFFYRNMHSTGMRKHAYVQLSCGPYNLMGENGQFTIFRDEAGEVGKYIIAMLSGQLTQKEYYLDNVLYRQELYLAYSVDGQKKQDVLVNALKRKPLFRSYQHVAEVPLVPLVIK